MKESDLPCIFQLIKNGRRGSVKKYDESFDGRSKTFSKMNNDRCAGYVIMSKIIGNFVGWRRLKGL